MKSLFSLLKNNKKQLSIIFILLFIQIFSALLLPSFMSKIVDVGIVTQDIPYIIRTGLIMLAVALVGSAATLYVGYLAAKISSQVGKDLRYDVFKKSESLSIKEFDEFGASSLITRTTGDITQVTTFLVMLLRMVLAAPFMLVGAVIMAVSQSLSMSTVLLVSVPALVLTIIIIGKNGFSLFGVVQKKVDGINRISREKLTGIRVIRAFHKDNFEKRRFDENNQDLTGLSIRVNRIAGCLQPIMVLIFNFTTIGVIYMGAEQINLGSLQVGDLMAFLQYVQQIMLAFIMVSFLFVMMPRAIVSINRINEVLHTKNSIVNKPNPILTPISKGNIQFQEVDFHFGDAAESVLTDLNITIASGEITAFIGSTGSGKSTLIKLLSRLYDINSGNILIDDVSIQDYDLNVLRDGVSCVPQKSMLFSGTVGENMRYGNESATDEEVITGLKIADAYDFVMGKEGLNTPVSQGGSNFSGGQRQRLCIARSIIKNSPIIIFDDSFSALDYKTDVKVRKALKEISSQKSIIIVAQRISTIMNADKIIVLDSGHVVGQGTHEALLKNCPVYKEIADSQATKEAE